MIKGIFSLQDGIVQNFSWAFFAIILLAVCTFAAVMKKRSKDLSETDGYYPIVDLSTVRGLTVFFVFVGLIIGLAYTGDNPFVYFQF